MMLHKLGIPFLSLMAFIFLPGFPSMAEASDTALRGGRAGVYGEILLIGENTLEVEGAQGVVTVVVDNHVRFRIPGDEDPTLADLAIGDHILARGMRRDRAQEDGGALLAAFIIREPEGERIVGRVLSTAEDELVLVHGTTETSVSVKPGTIVALPHEDLPWAEGGQARLREGLRLAAYGMDDTDNAQFAAHTLVLLPQARGLWRQHGLAGEILAIEGDAFTLMTQHGEQVEVQTGEETRYHLPSRDGVALSDFNVGDAVMILGKATELGTYNARVVATRPPNRPVAGTITAIEGDSFFLMNRMGLRLNVVTGEDTRFRVGPDTDATLSDFASGDRVLVMGLVSGEGQAPEDLTLNAQFVAKRAGQGGHVEETTTTPPPQP